MTYRQTVAAQFAAKPSTGPTLEQAREINAKRLHEKQSALTARIGKLIESLGESDVDDWISALDSAEQLKLSARAGGIGARLKSTFITGKK
jgi:hypothetical protein